MIASHLFTNRSKAYVGVFCLLLLLLLGWALLAIFTAPTLAATPAPMSESLDALAYDRVAQSASTMTGLSTLPVPLPRHCDGVTPPGFPDPCCIFGYVYFNGQAVLGAAVSITSANGSRTMLTAPGLASSTPHYQFDLSSAPISATVGSVLTLTASYNGMVSTRTWIVQPDGQHVDVGLIAGYGVTQRAASRAPGAPDTDVCGIIGTDTTWTPAGSPYIVTCNVLVNSGVRLTLQPGVQVKFNAGKALQIDGELIAQGTSTSPITFTANGGNWGYILFTDTSVDATFDGGGNYLSGSIIQYAVVEYAGGVSVTDNGAVRANAASPYIDHNTIRNNQADGVHVWNSVGIRITNNTISTNAGSGIYVAGGTATISGNTITGNVSSSSSTGGGIYFAGGTATISNNTITGNATSGAAGANYGGGICASGTVTIIGNAINGNSASFGAGIFYISGGGVVIRNNFITGNFGGGFYGSNATGTIDHNIIIGNSGGGILEFVGTTSYNIIANNTSETYGAGFRGRGTVQHNTFVGNVGTNIAAIEFSNLGGLGGDVSNNTILSNVTAGSINPRAISIGGHPTLNSNNIYGNTGYALYNGNAQGTANLNGTNNWWGTTSDPAIQSLIYDWFDDSSLGIVTYSPYRTAHNPDAPISPPTGFTVTLSGDSAILSWSPNPESDLAGYKVYWDTNRGYPYSNSVNVGNVTVYTLTSLLPDVRYYVTVTAYDTGLDGVDDQTDGNESWFADEKSIGIWTLPQANFVGAPTSGVVPLTVILTDTSMGGINSWSWTFGDGGISTTQNPTHTYTRTGVFTVSLTVSGPAGGDTASKVNYVAVNYPAPVAAFTAAPLSGTAPLTVTFTNQSTGNITSWLWDFGDGTSGSISQNPTHTYSASGVYTVSLTVNGPGGSNMATKIAYISVGSVRPQAAFTASPRSGPPSLLVTFLDQSTGDITTWSWDFGDGNASVSQNPTHTYSVSGTYTVSLTVNGPGGNDTATKVAYISVGFSVPQAAFTASPRSGPPPLTVNFTDQSSGDLIAWDWVFGDGDRSGARHPGHLYEVTGTYTVSLTASGPESTDIAARPNYIAVSQTVTPTTWTFILYFAGDNNLGPYLDRAIDNLERVADKPNVNIVVLKDGAGSGNTRLYHVQYDVSPGIVSPIVPVPWNPGELDMGQVRSLTQTVQWAQANYPADHYFLSIADHGRGTTGIAWDDTSGGDYLTAYSELKSALSASTGGGSSKIDVLYFDACLMGMIEDAYEVKDYVDYVVASENLGWSVFAYDSYVSSIAENTTPRDLAQHVADAYDGALNGYPRTIAALDMWALGDVGNAVDGFAVALNTYLTGTNVLQLIAIRDSVQTFDSRNYGVIDKTDEYVDLYHFAQLVKAGIGDTNVQNAAQAVMDTLNGAVVAEHHQSAVDPWSGNLWNLSNAHGLSIYFPPRSDGWDYQNYLGGAWSFSAAEWDEFLVTYFAMSGLPHETPIDPGVPPMQILRFRIYLPLIMRSG